MEKPHTTSEWIQHPSGKTIITNSLLLFLLIQICTRSETKSTKTNGNGQDTVAHLRARQSFTSDAQTHIVHVPLKERA